MGECAWGYTGYSNALGGELFFKKKLCRLLLRSSPLDIKSPVSPQQSECNPVGALQVSSFLGRDILQAWVLSADSIDHLSSVWVLSHCTEYNSYNTRWVDSKIGKGDLTWMQSLVWLPLSASDFVIETADLYCWHASRVS